MTRCTTWCRCMKIRVARMEYMNSEPFYYNMDREAIELYPGVPSALGQAAAQGKIDAGPLSLVDFWNLEDSFVQLGQFCIATFGKTRSVLFYSKCPVEQLDGACLGVTSHTSTAKRLLEVLLLHRFRVSPKSYVDIEEPNDAFLTIGDPALRCRYGVPSYPYRYDLGEEWYYLTGLPFVFAVWAVRKDLDPEAVAHLTNVLYGCIDDGMDHMENIGQMRQDVRMSAREVIEYYQGFRYWAGAAEQEGMKRFKGYLDQMKSSKVQN